MMNEGRRIARGARGRYEARRTELQYVYRCAACEAQRRVSLGNADAPVRLKDSLPPGWVILQCVAEDTAPLTFWLCPGCASTPAESHALAALRHPIRVLP